MRATIYAQPYADLFPPPVTPAAPPVTREFVEQSIRTAVSGAYALAELRHGHTRRATGVQYRDGSTPASPAAEFDAAHHAMLIRMGDTPEDAAREVAHYRATRNEYGLDAY